MTDREETPSAGPGLAEVQRRVQAYWDATGLPARARDGPPEGRVLRFTEGPPTANGLPHIGHVVGRSLKDAYLRYRRMTGHRIISVKAGWDCHGLPVELEIEKRHGLKSKKEIEAYGVERFCEECRASALETIAAWRRMSDRLGYWLDYDRPYYTMTPEYVESVWWSLRELHGKGLLEKGHYVLPYCPRCETSLSSHEVAQGYGEATDPSVTVRFELVGAPGEPVRHLLVWTTTPWTLPSNLLIAARSDLEYVAVVAPEGGEYVLAAAALPRYFPSAEVRARWTGADLAGRAYTPLFPFAGPGSGRYRVVLDEMVDAAEGTGFVHIAPSFGPDDARIGERERVGVFDPLDSRGVFTEKVPLVEGKGFKAADRGLLEHLEERHAVVKHETLRHTYPFCWRCRTPLIYRAIDSWFVRTSRVNGPLVANNERVGWHPEHLREGRFGNFLTEAKDWALSRSRYWGTPLPVWTCPRGHHTVVGSFAELAERNRGPLPAPFDPHRVTVDRIAFPCPDCGAEARREPYTIDAWYDSGSAPFAEFHYPFEPGPFDPSAPLDFVAEGIDQTRGWFYSMLVLSTALFGRPAYLNAVANGHVVDPTGQKMSKSRGNALDPMALLEGLGGDAVRWAFLSVDYTEPIVTTETLIRQTAARSLGTLLNVLVFYRENARLDGRTAARQRPEATALLDRWLLSRLAGAAQAASAGLADYDARAAALALRDLIDDLSTWYLRRSRPRFWAEGDGREKQAASDVLSYTLVQLARLLAPLAPFTAEHLYQELLGTGYDDAATSVHLAGWPAPLEGRDPELEEGMARLRGLVEVGRELRQRASVKSRIPLEELVLVGAPEPYARLGPEGERLLAEELNVLRVRALSAGAGPEAFPEESWVRREEAGRIVAALPRRPTRELLEEGWVRESLRRLQRTRKELALGYDERIRLTLFAEGELYDALDRSRERLANELQCASLRLDRGRAPATAGARSWEFGGQLLEGIVERLDGA